MAILLNGTCAYSFILQTAEFSIFKNKGKGDKRKSKESDKKKRTEPKAAIVTAAFSEGKPNGMDIYIIFLSIQSDQQQLRFLKMLLFLVLLSVPPQKFKEKLLLYILIIFSTIGAKMATFPLEKGWDSYMKCFLSQPHGVSLKIPKTKTR